MKYGLPYKGSKNKLAERIVSLLPKADHLIDLFCGGCAVSHCALLRGKWPHVHVNDINWQPVTLFMDVLDGKCQDERRWISHDDFFRLKDTDPYVAVVYSFGNNLRNYLYGRDIEPLKRAIHYAIFFSDYRPAADLSHDLSFLDDIPDTDRRYVAVMRYFSRFGHFRLQSFESGRRIQRLRPFGIAAPGMRKPCGRNQKKNGRGALLRTAQHHPTDWCTANTFPSSSVWGGRNVTLTSSVTDYGDVEIPDGSVIYCDIPYQDTDVYDKDNTFDYERFYNWCARQTQPLFISSYDMPADRFRCIEEYEHRSTLCATANNLITERIFIPIHQQPPKRPRQLTLFD